MTGDNYLKKSVYNNRSKYGLALFAAFFINIKRILEFLIRSVLKF